LAIINTNNSDWVQVAESRDGYWWWRLERRGERWRGSSVLAPEGVELEDPEVVEETIAELQAVVGSPSPQPPAAWAEVA